MPDKEGVFGMKQLSFFDLLEPEDIGTKEVPYGYLEDLSLVGRELKFTELKDMVGQKCLLARHSATGTSYRVVKITEYWENCDKVYKQAKPLPEGIAVRYGDMVNGYIHDVVGIKEAMDCYELAYECDRVAYSESDKKQDKNKYQVSESYCSNGRYEPLDSFESFYILSDAPKLPEHKKDRTER